MSETRLAELLCTRLCHDLTGPIGAVNNGAEFLSEEGFNLQSQAVELITSSAFSAVSRLQFYRLAYGRVKDSGEASLPDNQKLAADFFVGSKITLDWPDQYTDTSKLSISLRMVRLLFNLLIITSGALLKGGVVHVSITQDTPGQKAISVTAQGEAVKWEPETEKLLREPVDIAQISPRNVHIFITQKLAEELKVEFSFAIANNEVNITAVQRTGAESS